jgi:hypothetical protein
VVTLTSRNRKARIRKGKIVKPTDIVLTLRDNGEAGIASMIWAGPGVGKSEVVAQFAAMKTEKYPDGRRLVDLRMLLLDPTDLRGLPRINMETGVAEWVPPSFLPPTNSTDPWVLFLDELPAAPQLVQASGLQLVLDRRIGEYDLPKDCVVVAAGNRAQDRAVSHRMPSALSNRFMHLDFEPDVLDWSEWAARAGVPESLIAFLNFRPNLLNAFETMKDKSIRSFPTPRSWVHVGKILGMERGRLSEATAGLVGEGAAGEFMGFLDVTTKLPDIDAILAGTEHTVPDEAAVKYAAVVGVAIRAKEEHLSAAITYSLRFPAEFSVLCVKMLNSNWQKELRTLPVYREKWIPKFKKFIQNAD